VCVIHHRIKTCSSSQIHDKQSIEFKCVDLGTNKLLGNGIRGDIWHSEWFAIQRRSIGARSTPRAEAGATVGLLVIHDCKSPLCFYR
jgi:hypothetical protein